MRQGGYLENPRAPYDTVGGHRAATIIAPSGVKGLQLARAGVTAGNFGKFLNLTSSSKPIPSLALQRRVVALFLACSENRLKYLGCLKLQTNKLMASAAELMIAGTMNDSPVFDGDSVGDFGWNIALGAGIGGLLGGGIGSIAAKGILRSAEKEIQAVARLHDVV